MTVSDVARKLVEIEKRLEKIEEAVFSNVSKRKQKKSDYKGLTGGIMLLIENGFFKQLREVNDVNMELKREGYHYPIPSISKTLSVDFTNKKKIFNRMKEGTSWKYVLRK